MPGRLRRVSCPSNEAVADPLNPAAAAIEGRQMRILGFVVICAVAFCLGDAIFNNSRYCNQLWQELARQVHNADYEVRRWIRF
jgi:hypothetical protein